MPVDRYQNSTNYQHPQESNLLNVEKALQYRDVTGEPELRVNIGDATATITGTVAVSNFPTSTTVYQGTDPWNIVGTVNTIFNPVGTDAFGRQRVSEPYTLGDYSHTYGEETELLTKTSGAESTSTTIANQASIRLTVGTSSTAYVIHQSRMYHHYMPGKSQLTFASFNFVSSATNTYKRIGLFDDYNGIFFQQSGDGSLQLVFRSDVSGVVVDEAQEQINWNIDPCNGTGPSGFDLKTNKAQLFYCDFQWLGVGRVRAGFVHNGNIIVAHEFYHSNVIETVYWSNPSLPIRCELRKYGETSTTTYMDQMCATVMSEGGYKESGVDNSASDGVIQLIKGSPGSYKAVMALRLKNTYKGRPNRSIVRILNIDILSESTNCQYELWRVPNNAAVSGGSWISAGDNSVVEYNTSASSFDTSIDSSRIITGWVSASNPSGKQASGASAIPDPSSAKRGYISQNIDSDDSNIFLLIMRNLSSTSDTNVYASMQWRETR